jgi:hypothetical protein
VEDLTFHFGSFIYGAPIGGVESGVVGITIMNAFQYVNLSSIWPVRPIHPDRKSESSYG